MQKCSSFAIQMRHAVEAKRVFAPAVIKLAANFGSSLTLFRLGDEHLAR